MEDSKRTAKQIGDTRKSQNCPRCCDKDNCYEKYEQWTIDGKKIKLWGLHCETLGKIEGKAFKKIS